jgi:demethylmenaquinone methyltransferase / 2-methoxy-6-polyprenyl-1,4-benzoquinol methylase
MYEDRSESVAALFDRNAARYDRVNTAISFGRDAVWRRWTASRALAAAGATGRSGSPRILDACGGTGLVTLELARGGARVTLADVSAGMLAVAERRAATAGVPLRIVQADLVAEPAARLPDAPFAAVTLVFGLRYMRDPVAFLGGLADALAPGGAIVVLEFVVPPRRPFSAVAAAYFFGVLPRVATLLAGRAELYDALTATVRALGTLPDLLEIVRSAGLRPLETRTFAQGIVAGIVACPASGSVKLSDE